jgi:hypothetical protein
LYNTIRNIEIEKESYGDIKRREKREREKEKEQRMRDIILDVNL